MLVTDPLGTQAAAVAGLYSSAGRIELVQRAGSVRSTKVRVTAAPKAWTFVRPVDRKWRLESVNWYGRVEPVRGRGCDVYGLPVTSRTLLASLDSFVVGPAQRKAVPFAVIRWFDSRGAATTGGTITMTGILQMSGTGTAISGGVLATTGILRMTGAGTAPSGGSAVMPPQTWRTTASGTASSGGAAALRLTTRITGAGTATSGGTATLT